MSRPLRLARVTLTAYAVLDEGDSVASLTPEDTRDILLTAVNRRTVPHFGAAGSFGHADKTWVGVYDVETAEVLAGIAGPDQIPADSDPIENGRALARLRREQEAAGQPLEFRRVG